MIKKKLGILGGMGPEATSYFFQRVIYLTRAERDSDHIEVILHSNTKIPDRTQAIINNGESPVSEMLRSARLLERAGADLIAIPCITAHYYIDNIASEVSIPILNAVKETVSLARATISSKKHVGILATSGTVQSGLFQDHLTKRGLLPIIPPPEMQEVLVMEAIYGKKGIKAGYLDGDSRAKLLSAAEYLIKEGAQAIIAGCTEIPLALHSRDFSIPFLEPMDIIARLAVQQCLAPMKEIKSF